MSFVQSKKLSVGLGGWGGGRGPEARQVRALYKAGSFLFSCLLLF